MAIYPTPQQIETLLAGPADQPVVMVNLLRFKRRADGADEGVGRGGVPALRGGDAGVRRVEGRAVPVGGAGWIRRSSARAGRGST